MFRRLRMKGLVVPASLMLLAAILSFAAGCGDVEINTGGDSDDPVETRDDSFTVGPSQRLVVDTFNGRVSVSAGSSGTIRVQTTLKRADKLDYDVSQDGDTVRVEAKRKGTTIGRSPGATIEVTTPPNTTLDLRTSNGAIEVRGIEASGDLDTSNGEIVLENVTGDFDGELTPGTSNELATSNGSVKVRFRGTPSVRLDASTSNGSVTSKLPLLTTSAGKTSLSGTLGDGDAELKVRTSNGSITIE